MIENVALPKVGCDAILRAIQRSEEFDLYAIENPCEAFMILLRVFLEQNTVHQ